MAPKQVVIRHNKFLRHNDVMSQPFLVGKYMTGLFPIIKIHLCLGVPRAFIPWTPQGAMPLGTLYTRVLPLNHVFLSSQLSL